MQAADLRNPQDKKALDLWHLTSFGSIRGQLMIQGSILIIIKQKFLSHCTPYKLICPVSRLHRACP